MVGLGNLALILLIPDVPCSLGEMLALGLRAFLELMEHGVVSWETLSISFVRKVCPCPGAMGQGQHLALMNEGDTLYPLQVISYVNMNLMDASVQPLALRLLESVTLSSPALGQLVKSEVPLDRLLVHLQV